MLAGWFISGNQHPLMLSLHTCCTATLQYLVLNGEYDPCFLTVLSFWFHSLAHCETFASNDFSLASSYVCNNTFSSKKLKFQGKILSLTESTWRIKDAYFKDTSPILIEGVNILCGWLGPVTQSLTPNKKKPAYCTCVVCSSMPEANLQ